MYTLKMSLLGPEDVGVDVPGPEVGFAVEIDGVDFYLDAPYEEILDDSAKWKAGVELADGKGAGRFKNIDATLDALIHRYVHCELPNVENCELPYEGVDGSVLRDALERLESDGVELYEDGSCVYARYPEDPQADFSEYQPTDAYGAAVVLDESMEYECDWSDCEVHGVQLGKRDKAALRIRNSKIRDGRTKTRSAVLSLLARIQESDSDKRRGNPRK